MYKLGEYNILEVEKFVDFGVYLFDSADDRKTILLPIKQVPEGTKVGDEINVFIYTDSEDRPIATTLTPFVTAGNTAILDVVETTKFGAFLDWGLPKDLFLPFKHQLGRINKGDKCLVRVFHDIVSDRIVATMKVGKPYDPKTGKLYEGNRVTMTIVEETDLGFKVLVNNKYHGMIYDDDIKKDYSIGDIESGFLKKIRPDGKLDISLKEFGGAAVISDRAMILKMLKDSKDGSLPYNAKSSADDIEDVFNLSKKAFKRAIGALYKERKIEMTDNGMKLVK